MEIYKVFKCILTAFILFPMVDGSHKMKGKKFKRLEMGNNSCGCGIANSEGTRLIINGENVKPPDRFPWMVSIMERKTKHKFCGGAIISSKAILTAAHCLLAFNIKDLNGCLKPGKLPQPCLKNVAEISIGLVTKTNDISIFSRVFNIIPHPDYHPSGITADIGLIILRDPIPCSQSTKPICLPEKAMSNPGVSAIFAGWGTIISVVKYMSENLRQANLKVVPKKDCMVIKEFEKANKSALCLLAGNQSPCHGDSGGSLFFTENGTYYTLGVTALHTSVLCKKTEPVVFTDVHYYLPFIRRNIKKYKET